MCTVCGVGGLRRGGAGAALPSLLLLSCMLALVVMCCKQTAAAPVTIQGSTTRCANEGESVDIWALTGGQMRNQPCIHCVCRQGRVHCAREPCADTSACPVVLADDASLPGNGTSVQLASHALNGGNMASGRADGRKSCCVKCRPCAYAGALYENGQHWLSQQDACRTLTCKAGVVTMSRMQCVLDCDKPVHLPGHCCPFCPKDARQGARLLAAAARMSSGGWLRSAKLAPVVTLVEQQHAPVDVSQPSEENNATAVTDAAADKCVKCQCFDFGCQCYRMACPALDCPQSDHYLPTNSCCPECRTQSVAQPSLRGQCTFQRRTYEHQRSFRPDSCTLCKCEDSVVICRRFVCPKTDCPASRLVLSPGLCCPFCSHTEPKKCHFEEQEYAHGSRWQADPCTSCQCTNGSSICSKRTCPLDKVARCPKGYAKVPPRIGQCCERCELKEATCSVFGDPHYTTFDGLNYEFHGTCRYVLAQQCTSRSGSSASVPSFSIVAHNVMGKRGAAKRGRFSGARTQHLTVRLRTDERMFGTEPNVIRLSLLQSKRLKENGRLRRLPYVKLGVYSAMMDRRKHLVLRVFSGRLKIVWDGYSLVQITLDKEFMGAVCGLCGNFNLNPSDDVSDDRDSEMLVQNGRQIHANVSRHQAAQSWIYGGWRKCASKQDRMYHRWRKQKLRAAARAPAASGNKLSNVAWNMLTGGRAASPPSRTSPVHNVHAVGGENRPSHRAFYRLWEWECNQSLHFQNSHLKHRKHRQRRRRRGRPLHKIDSKVKKCRGSKHLCAYIKQQQCMQVLGKRKSRMNYRSCLRAVCSCNDFDCKCKKAVTAVSQSCDIPPPAVLAHFGTEPKSVGFFARHPCMANSTGILER